MGKFTENTIITFLTRATTTFFTLIVTIIIARAFGPEKQGIYSLVILFPSLLLVFTSFSINPSVSYFLGKRKYSREEIFSSNVILNIIISSFSLLSALIIIYFLRGSLFPGIEKIYLILSLLLIPSSLFFDLTCQFLLGIQSIKKYNTASLFQNFLFLSLIIVFILGLNFGITVALIAQFISFFLGIVFSVFLISKEIKIFSWKLNIQYSKDVFLYGAKLHLGSIFGFLHYRIDLLLLNIFLNPLAVGFYYLAARLAESTWLFSSSAANIFFPKISSEKNAETRKQLTPLVCRNVLLVTLLIAGFLFLLGKIIFSYLGYLESAAPFKILLLGTLAVSIWRIMHYDLASRGKPMIGTYSIAGSVILNIALNIFLIPKFGIIGAAWSTTISYFAMFLIVLFYYKKISDNKLRDIIFFKKGDLYIYKNLILIIKQRFFKL